MLKAFDGFELPINIKLNLEELNKWVFEKTTIPMQFVVKKKEYVLDLTGYETSENANINEYNEIKEEFEKCKIIHDFITDRFNHESNYKI